MYRIELIHSIRDVNRGDWDELVGGDVMTSYGWLRSIEETYTQPVHYHYHLLWKEEQLMGAAIAYRHLNKHTNRNLDGIFFGRQKALAQKLRLSFHPVLEISPFRCYGKHLIVDRELEDYQRKQVMLALLNGIETDARKRRLALSFIHVMEPEQDLVRLLKTRGYHWTLDYPVNYLDIEWSDFEGYKQFIGQTSRNMKRNIAKEVNRIKRAGVVIEELGDIGHHELRLWELFNLNYQKYNRDAFPFKPDFARRLKANLPHACRFLVARKNGLVSAVCLMLRSGKEVYIPMIGVDYALAKNDATYFNIGFYHPIREALATGVKRLHLGNAQYLLKRRRGCKASPCYIYYKSFNPYQNRMAALWLVLHRYWFQKKHARYDLQPFVPLTDGET